MQKFAVLNTNKFPGRTPIRENVLFIQVSTHVGPLFHDLVADDTTKAPGTMDRGENMLEKKLWGGLLSEVF